MLHNIFYIVIYFKLLLLCKNYLCIDNAICNKFISIEILSS